jgi:putative spermidine/putrescine transport system ATP-binding protein
MSNLTLQNLRKSFGPTVAVDNVSLEVRQGELVALLGPSGCGKTTTLRMIAGFIGATAGRILIGGSDVTTLPPYRRNTGMVFQSYALFPHMTVAENVAFGLEMRKVPKAERERRVEEALRLVRLEGLGHRMPRQLSGGQQQRVALARGLVINPEVFLLDEPLSNLDAKLRHDVRLEIRQLQQRLGLTTVFVTHDQEEALTLADRLVLMEKGVVQQIGTPTELYERPANLFVADFIGKSNFFKGRIAGQKEFRTEAGTVIRFEGPAPAGAGTVLAVRPEKIILGPGARDMTNCFPASIEYVTYLGAATEYRLRFAEGDAVTVHEQNRSYGQSAGGENGEVEIGWDPAACLLLPDRAAPIAGH